MLVLSHFGYVPSLDFSGFSMCEHYLYGKQAMNSHFAIIKKRSEPLELVHSDVCGPMPTVSMGGASYFVTFIDDFSWKVWAYPLKHKDEVLFVFKRFVTLVEIETGKKVKCLGFGNGREYVSKSFQDFCDTKGIKRELTAPYTPPQNGVAKRMNWTVQERLKSMLSNAELSNGFWAKALATVVHLIHMSPNKRLDLKVAQEICSGKPPLHQHL